MTGTVKYGIVITAVILTVVFLIYPNQSRMSGKDITSYDVNCDITSMNPALPTVIECSMYHERATVYLVSIEYSTAGNPAKQSITFTPKISYFNEVLPVNTVSYEVRIDMQTQDGWREIYRTAVSNKDPKMFCE
ncbi:MAG: hypothetical protein V1921_06815 [Candidatus Altiarchaeota archaeon]